MLLRFASYPILAFAFAARNATEHLLLCFVAGALSWARSWAATPKTPLWETARHALLLFELSVVLGSADAGVLAGACAGACLGFFTRPS